LKNTPSTYPAEHNCLFAAISFCPQSCGPIINPLETT
jgi:hypothetical protein